MRYAMIMAGGAGKRLWPASRQNKPKQLIRFFDDKSLLELALERLEGLFPSEQTFIITNASYVESIRERVSQLPAENIIGEPEGRDTANAIALGAEIIAARDADATMAVFTADHIIRPVDEFQQCVEKACQAAEDDPKALVTFGIRPTHPHTGLGYIQCGEGEVRKVFAFKEKPDHHTARYYVESGRYFWNSGMFIWKVQTIREALQKYLPESAEAFKKVGEALRKGEDITNLLKEIYPQLPKISIDYAVMEKADHVLMVELTCSWLDVGSWPALAEVVSTDADGNAVLTKRAIVIDGSSNILFSEDDHLIALMGLDECIVVHTPDATLVCNKSDAQRLKELVEKVGEKYGQEYL